MTSLHCTRCHYPLASGDAFCPECGQPQGPSPGHSLAAPEIGAAGQGQRRLIVGAATLCVVLLLAVGWFALPGLHGGQDRGDASSVEAGPTGEPLPTPTVAAPTSLPSSTGSGPSSPAGPHASAPTDGQVVTDASGRPEGRQVARTFQLYVGGIDGGDPSSAYTLLSKRAQQRTSLSAFLDGISSTTILDLTVRSVTPGASPRAVVAFRSLQDAVSGGTGQTCSDWVITYTMQVASPHWLIDRAAPAPGSPAPCTP